MPEELKNLDKIKEIHISRDLRDGLKKQLIEWFGKEKIKVIVDEPYFLDEPDYIKRMNVF